MFRTVMINNGEKLYLENGWMMVERDDETIKIPIVDIYSIVIDNLKLSVSTGLINELTKNGTHIIFCDIRHKPQRTLYPNRSKLSRSKMLKFQIKQSEDLKGELWQKIVSAKIKYQKNLLEYIGADQSIIDAMESYEGQVECHDITNREGLAARLYFGTLLGNDFRRMTDDNLNYALNYGYAILRSSIVKTLACHGVEPSLGVHHCSDLNPYNLADDIIEVFRPLVDKYVYQNSTSLMEDFTIIHRKELVAIIDSNVRYNGKITSARVAIDEYVNSYINTLKTNNADNLVIPEIIFNL